MNSYEIVKTNLSPEFSGDRQAFKELMGKAYGVEHNPKFSKLYDMAWEIGHSYGYHEVLLEFDEMVDLIQDVPSWTPVEESLPKFGQPVVVWIKVGNTERFATAMLDLATGWLVDVATGWLELTHWMIPVAPAKIDDGGENV